jgi:hypothetical protein
MIIESIDKEFNEQLLTGKGLDSNLFSTKELLQYYQISNFSHLSQNDFQLKLNEFVSKNYKLNNFSNFTILFYKKESFVNYSDYVYEAARDNQNGSIEEYKSNLIAKIVIVKVIDDQEKVVRYTTLYDNDLVVFEKIDKISLK